LNPNCITTGAGKARAGVDPDDLLRAVASLSTPTHDGDPRHARRMVALLVDGLRYGARVAGRKSNKRLNPRPHHSKLNAGRPITGSRKIRRLKTRNLSEYG